MMHSHDISSSPASPPPRAEGETTLSPVPRGCQAIVRHFSIAYYNRDARPLGEHTFSFECGAHPSTDIAFYRVRDGALSIAVREAFRHPLALRAELPVTTEGERFGPHRSLPSERGWAKQALGGPYLPSAGSSTETCLLAPVEFHGDAEELGAEYRFVSAREIIDGYLSGTPADTRLVLAALRLSSSLGLGLSVDLGIESRTRASATEDALVPKRSAAFLRQHLHAPPLDESAAYTIACREALPPQRSFLRHLELTVQDGPDTAATSRGEAIVRRGIDSVDVGAYTWSGDELCLVIKRGLRPALTARALTEGHAPSPTSALAYEGIAESLEGECSIDAIAARAAQGVREEAGIEPVGTPLYVGSSYPSPGLHAERVFNFLIEVDRMQAVEAEHTLDERVDVACVPVHDIIELCDEGCICDPRLEINARLLAGTLASTGRR